MRVAALLVIVALSSVTMLWLLCRVPLPTCIITALVLGALFLFVRFARSIDPDESTAAGGGQYN
jgi:hypothetical protein